MTARGPFGNAAVGLMLLTGAAAAAEPAGDAPAGSSDGGAQAEASQLHRQAEQALAVGDWATACPLYAASQARHASAPTQGRIAQCLEHEGKLASALSAYEEALRLVPQLDDTRRALAAERLPRYIAELERRVPQIVLRVAPELAGASVRWDGAVLSESELGQPLRVDPGSHVILVAAHGFVEQSCELQPAEAARLELQLGPRRSDNSNPVSDLGCESASDTLVRVTLAAAVAPPSRQWGTSAASAAEAVPPLAAAAPAGAAPAAPSSVPLADDAAWQRALGYGIGGAGAAGLVLAGYFGVRTLSLVDRAECDGNGNCSARGVQTMQDAEQSQTAGFVTAGVSAALVGAGLALLWSAAPHESEPSNIKIGIAPRNIWMSARW